MAKRALVAHPDRTPPPVSVGAKISRLGRGVLQIEYVVTGDIDCLLIPPPEIPTRRDELWQHSCLEAFIGAAHTSYIEYNFSPSRQWAAYRFDDYRDGMQPAVDLPQPQIFVERNDRRLALTAVIELPDIERSLRIGLSAVIEEQDGTKSYWALAHPPGKPDFHHPDCFALELPAPQQP